MDYYHGWWLPPVNPNDKRPPFPGEWIFYVFAALLAVVVIGFFFYWLGVWALIFFWWLIPVGGIFLNYLLK